MPRSYPCLTSLHAAAEYGDDHFSLCSFDQTDVSPGGDHLFPTQSPNFQKIFQQRQVLPEAKGAPHYSKPPRYPPPPTNPDLTRRQQYLGQENNRNYPKMGDVAEEQGGIERRSSPRTNKGKNSHLLEKVDDSQKIPRKPKPKPAAHPTDSSRASVDDPTDTAVSIALTVDSTPTRDNSSESAQLPPSTGKLVSADESRRRLEAKKVEWEKEDNQKTKKVLVKDLILSKANEFILEHNFKASQSQFKKTLETAKDFKAKALVLAKLVEKDKVKIETLEDELENTQEELHKTQEELQKGLEEKESLRKKLAQSIKTKRAVRTKQNGADHDATLLGIIEVKAKTVLWGLVKFIQSPDEELIAAKFLVKYGDIPSNYCATKQEKQEIAELYSDKIKKAVFCKRNYTTAEAKKYYVKMWKNGKKTLTVEELKKCLQRDIKNQNDMDIFMLYWEEYLPKQVGAMEWDKNTRYYVTLSEAMRKDCKSHELHLVTPEDEAFLVLSIENGVQRWKEEFDLKKEGKKATDTEEANNYSGLYTSTTSGQNQYGGWSEQGLELFKTYVATNEAARKDPKTAQVERDCLQSLRVKYGIQSDTAEEHNKHKARMKSARKRGREEVAMPPMKKVVRTMRMWEESDEDTDDDE